MNFNSASYWLILKFLSLMESRILSSPECWSLKRTPDSCKSSMELCLCKTFFAPPIWIVPHRVPPGQGLMGELDICVCLWGALWLFLTKSRDKGHTYPGRAVSTLASLWQLRSVPSLEHVFFLLLHQIYNGFEKGNSFSTWPTHLPL